MNNFKHSNTDYVYIWKRRYAEDNVYCSRTLKKGKDGHYDLVINRPTKTIVEGNGITHEFIDDSVTVIHDVDRLLNFTEILNEPWTEHNKWEEKSQQWVSYFPKPLKKWWQFWL